MFYLIATIIVTIASVILIIAVCLQEGKSAGLSGSISGGSETYWSRNKGRSKEGRLEKITIIMMVIFNMMGIMASPGILGLVFPAALLIGQLILLFATKTHAMIHDKISDCVVVDMSSQMIFDSEQARIDYIAEQDAREAASSPY